MISRRKLKEELRKHLSDSLRGFFTARIMEQASAEFKSDYTEKNGKAPGKKQWDVFWKDQIQSGKIANEAEGLINETASMIIKQVSPSFFIKNGIVTFLPAFWLWPMAQYAVLAWGKFLGKEDAFSSVGTTEAVSSSLAVITLLMFLLCSLYSISRDRD